MIEPMNWLLQGACHGRDPDLWWPVTPQDPNVERGRAVCAACPVRDACLDYATRAREEHGTWGGETEWERRNRLRSTTQPPAPAHRPEPVAPPQPRKVPAKPVVRHRSPVVAAAQRRAQRRAQERRDTALVGAYLALGWTVQAIADETGWDIRRVRRYAREACQQKLQTPPGGKPCPTR